MLKRRLLAFALLTALSITAVACSGGDSDSRGVRNASLPRLAPNGETIYVSNGDGTAKGCTVGTTVRLLQDASCVTVALRTASNKIRTRQLAKYNLIPDVVNPVASFWTELVRVQRFAGSAPIIARLPVAFNPAQVGIAFRAGVKESDAAWSGTSITHMSRDASIAAATIALANRLNSMSTYKSRTVDVQKMYSALTTTDTTKIVGSGKSVSVSTGFAQLGVVPFVRIFATEAETRQLLSEKLIAGAQMESVTNVSDVESLELVGVSGWTEEKPSGFWSPAIENVPTGNGAIVAVSDSGILSSHPAFGGRVVREGCYSPVPTECNGSNPNAVGQGAPCGFAGCDHGTHVAGIIAAQETTLSDGTVVPRGMAPGAQLIAYRTCPGDPASTVPNCRFSAAISGMGDTAQFVGTGANVVAFNMSHGFPYWDDAAVAAIAVLVAADVIVTLANGNSGGTNWQCGNLKLPGVYVVANMKKDRTPSPDTDFSPFCTDLWAPGTSITSATFSVNGATFTPGAGKGSGTSMAAPHVAGAAALIDEGLRRVATQNGTEPASLVANFDWYSGITEPIKTLADNRNTCSSSSGNVPCTASNSKKPTLDLRRVVGLVSPNGVTSTWVDEGEVEARYQTQLRQQTPASWSVEPTARTTTIAINASSRFDGWQVPTGTIRRYIGDYSTWRGDERIDNEGLSPSSLSVDWYLWVRTDVLMVVVENGSLAKVTSTWTLGDGSKQKVDLTSVAKMVARGPMACMNSGWIEMWMIKPSEVTLPAVVTDQDDVVLQATLSGPVSASNSPKATMYGFYGDEFNPNYSAHRKGTFTMSISPLAVTAPAQRGPVAPQVFTSPVQQKAANWQWNNAQTGTTDFLVHVPSGGLNADATSDQIPRIGSLITHFGFSSQFTVRHPRLRLKHVPDVWDASGNPLKTSVGFRANTTDRQACYTVLMANTSVIDQTQP